MTSQFDQWGGSERRAADSGVAGFSADTDDLVDGDQLKEAEINPHSKGGKSAKSDSQSGMPPMMMGGGGKAPTAAAPTASTPGAGGATSAPLNDPGAAAASNLAAMRQVPGGAGAGAGGLSGGVSGTGVFPGAGSGKGFPDGAGKSAGTTGAPGVNAPGVNGLAAAGTFPAGPSGMPGPGAGSLPGGPSGMPGSSAFPSGPGGLPATATGFPAGAGSLAGVSGVRAAGVESAGGNTEAAWLEAERVGRGEQPGAGSLDNLWGFNGSDNREPNATQAPGEYFAIKRSSLTETGLPGRPGSATDSSLRSNDSLPGRNTVGDVFSDGEVGPGSNIPGSRISADWVSEKTVNPASANPPVSRADQPSTLRDYESMSNPTSINPTRQAGVSTTSRQWDAGGTSVAANYNPTQRDISSYDGYSSETQNLRSTAAKWSQLSAEMQAVASQSSLNSEFGFVQQVTPEHEKLKSAASNWSGGASNEFDALTGRLNSVANAYDATEADNTNTAGSFHANG